MFSKILVASDGSSPSMEAARASTAIAKAFSGNITVVTVASLPETYQDDLSREMRQGYLDDWKAILDNTISEIKREGVEVTGKLVEAAMPQEGLLRELEAGGYDLLVVGRSGSGSRGLGVMGSVSRGVAEKASCAVLVVG